MREREGGGKKKEGRGGGEGGEREKRVKVGEGEEGGREKERDSRLTVTIQETEDCSTCSEAEGYYRAPVLVKLHERFIIAQVMHHNVATLQPDPYHIYCRGLGEDQHG